MERYGGKPIPGAIVFIKDGPDAGASLKTDSKGYFKLVGLKRLDFSLFFVASGFTDSIIDVAKNSLGEIGLSPLFTDYSVSGRFRRDSSETSDDVNQTRQFTTHRTGPVTLSIHADCDTNSTAEPLRLTLLSSNGSDIAHTSLGSATEDAAIERVLPPADYSARFQAASQIRGGCAWSMTVRAPL